MPKSNFDTVYGEPFVSPIIRPQWVSLAEPDTGNKFSRGNYCLTALLPKSDKKGLKEILQAVADTAGVDIDSVNELKKHPLLDGDGNFRDGDDKAHAQKEGHVGSYFFIVGSNNQPETYIIDPESGEPIECNPKEIYAGCYCQLVLQPAMYGEGEITFYLQAVMKVEDGDRFKASRTDAKSLFTNWANKANVNTTPTVKTAVSKRVVTDEVVEEDDQEEAPKRGRGRPTKVNGVAKASKIVEEEEEIQESEVEDDDNDAPVLPPIAKRERKLKKSIKELLD